MLSQSSFNLSVTNWTDGIGAARGKNMFEFGEAGYYRYNKNKKKWRMPSKFNVLLQFS